MFDPKASLYSGAGSSAPAFFGDVAKKITHNTKLGGGEYPVQRVMTAQPEEQTVTGHGAGTLVKSPSTPAPGVSFDWDGDIRNFMAAHGRSNWEMMMADQLRDARADARYWRLMFIGIAVPVGIVLVAYGWAWMRLVGWLQ